MKPIQYRFLLFLFGCIGTRILLMYIAKTINLNYLPYLGLITLHRPKRKMRQNAVMIYIFYNYVSSSLLNVPL
jgi:hypothetical protein